MAALGAGVLYGAVLVDALLRADRFTSELRVGAVAGVVLLAVALVLRQPWLLGPSLLLAGAVYLGALEAGRSGVDGTAPLVATGLFLCAELARWSFDLRLRISGDGQLVLRRAGGLFAFAVGATVIASAVVAVSAIGAPRDVAWTALGATAAAGAAGLGVWLVRR